MIRGLIFDFDGLILDTESAEYRSWQEVFREHGRDLALSDWTQGIGRGVGDIAFDPYAALEAASSRSIDRAAIRLRRRRRYADLVAAETVLPGAEEYMAAARRRSLVLGVASSSSREWVDEHLTRLGLRAYITALACADDVGRAKPDPAVYRAVLRRLHLRPNEVIAFEDSPSGLAAARSAGIPCVVVPNPLTAQLPLDHADLRLTSLADVPLDMLLLEMTRRAGSLINEATNPSER
jgi:HAD superfamily hydrolase (TIGR01509 family)